MGTVLLAAVCMMANGIQSRSLLLDEALFARNLAKFPHGYFIPMAPSPPLFYFAAHVLVSVFGRSEWVLRLIPLLAAVSGLTLLAVFLGRSFSRPVALTALAMAALSVPLVHFASNAHPYTADFFVSVLLWVLAEPLLSDRFSLRRWNAWLAVAVLSFVFSFPSYFVTASLGAVLLLRELGTRDRKTVSVKIAGLTVLACIATLLVFLLFVKQSVNRDLNYWVGYFPAGRGVVPWLKFAYRGTVHAIGYLFFNGQESPLGLFLMLAGTSAMVARGYGLEALACWGPVGCTVAASFFQKWPYGGVRTVLFLLPFFLIPMAHGLEWVWRSVKGRIAKAILCGALVLLLVPHAWVLRRVTVPAGDTEEAVKSLSRSVRPLMRDDDTILVYYAAEVQFRFYFPERIGQAVFEDWSDRGNAEALADFVKRHASGCHGRFWLVFSHLEPGEDTVQIASAERFGKQSAVYDFPGCRAVLFQCLNPK
jgi:hypothetical protein